MARPLRERAGAAPAAATRPRTPARARRRRWRRAHRAGRCVATARACCSGSGGRGGGQGAPRRDRCGDGARQGVSDARAPRGSPRPTRFGAARRSGSRARASDPQADAGVAGPHPHLAAPPARRGRDARRRSAAPAGDVHGDDCVRDRAHLGPRGARLAAAGDRVGALPTHALLRRAGTAAQALEPGRGDGALPAARVPRAEAILRRGSRRDDSDARRGDRARCAGRRSRGRAGDGASRRLNVLAHVVGRPYETILREFEGERTIEAVVSSEEGGSGDVKYHLGAQGTRSTPTGDITITLVANPSHLEAVDPVVEGRARAEQTDRSSRQGYHDPSVALPILIHGDASFAGQGSVAETLNLMALAGYSTGGTLHLIANNQVGFTTDPESGRSTRYSSDLAKGFDIPIVHVNADDPEAALASIRLALAYRRRFGHDVVVDLVGYRRHGHNEQDEAAYTQPLLAAAIAEHPTVREEFAARLVADGDLTQEQADELDQDVLSELRRAHEALKETFGQAEPPPRSDTHIPAATGDEVVTAVAPDRLRALNEQLLRVPDGFTPHPKLMSQLERRRGALEEGGIDWGQAEALAFASLLVEGIPIRLTGQDTERGTFSHRHDVLHDVSTGATYTPLQHLDDAGAAFEIYNSPLSEYACVGFEYGYAAAAPEALVLWEAQFGDFVNGAQIIIDQFIAAGLSKWRESTRLTLLLPHGYEGNGPEHSSARLERFLQLAAQENIRIANCTTSAQYFHLLRRQALDATARPLVVMTPKGLLRLKQASSTLDDLARGEFHS